MEIIQARCKEQQANRWDILFVHGTCKFRDKCKSSVLGILPEHGDCVLHVGLSIKVCRCRCMEVTHITGSNVEIIPDCGDCGLQVGALLCNLA